MTALIVFLITPLNWWARYTAWIYGIGLPCFAWTWHTVCSRPGRGRGIALAWLACALTLLIVDSAVCLNTDARCAILEGSLRGRTLHLKKWSAAEARFDLRNTPFCQVLADRHPVAFGYSSSVRNLALLGQLSSPIGCRQIVPLPKVFRRERLDALLRSGVKYVIWNDKNWVPPALIYASSSVQKVPLGGPRDYALVMALNRQLP